MGTDNCVLTMERVESLLKTRFGGVLRSGGHTPDSCEVCVRELRAIACEIGWTDKPDDQGEMTLTDRICQSLNDANWSGDEARTKNCLPLALLSEHTAPEGWMQVLATSVIREIVPIALRSAASIHPDQQHKEAMESAALECEQNPASYAAGDAARVARAAASDGVTAAASYAASDASYAARAAARAAGDAARAASDAASDASYAVTDAASAAARAAASAAARAITDAASAAASDEVLALACRLLLKAHGREDLLGNG